ncbi:MAG: response regulator transcription factor [Syntrophobacterales bacterium]|jgi:DNA-binding NarL/FixJ family response regulator|nr:response regulator transcription factor [Syntrophobacterales bacterium]
MITRILIADDHQIVRQGLRFLLEKEPDMKVVAEAEDGRMTVRLTRELNPGVIIMDVAMPDLNGIEATRQIITEFPTTKVIALSMYADRRFVVNMLKAGASAYLLKDCAFEELTRAIRVVLAHKTYLSPGVTDILVKDCKLGTPPSEVSAFGVLTPREREVLQLMSEGRSTTKIADHLHVSVKTVESHRQQLMQKLNLHSVAELTKYAIREGLTSLEA